MALLFTFRGEELLDLLEEAFALRRHVLLVQLGQLAQQLLLALGQVLGRLDHHLDFQLPLDLDAAPAIAAAAGIGDDPASAPAATASLLHAEEALAQEDGSLALAGTALGGAAAALAAGARAIRAQFGAGDGDLLG